MGLQRPDLSELVDASVRIVQAYRDQKHRMPDPIERRSMEGGRKTRGTLYAVSVYAYLARLYGYSLNTTGKGIGRTHSRMGEALHRIEWARDGDYRAIRRLADRWVSRRRREAK